MNRYLFSYSISDQLRSFQIDFIKIFLIIYVVTTLDLKELNVSLSGVSFQLKNYVTYLNQGFLVVSACGSLYLARLVREFSLHVWSEARSQLQYLDQSESNRSDPALEQPPSRQYLEETERKISREVLTSEIFIAETIRTVSSVVTLAFDTTLPALLTIYSIYRYFNL